MKKLCGAQCSARERTAVRTPTSCSHGSTASRAGPARVAALAMFLGAALTAFAACTARRSEPITGTRTPRSAAVVSGEMSFMAHCHSCHPHGEAGLGPSLNDKPLPGFLMKVQVRQGIGAMPAFDEGELAPDELDRIVDYLLALRAVEPER